MSDPDRQIWDAMLAHLRASHASICRQWFEELSPLGVVGGLLQLRTHSPLHRDYLRRQCLDQFNDAARTVSGRLLSVKFLGPDDEPLKTPSQRKSERSRADVLLPAEAPAPPTPVATPEPAAAAPVQSPAPPVEVRPAPPQPVEVLAPPSSERFGTGTHYESLVINPDYAFENFVQGPNNRLAHAAALAVAANPGRTYNPYFVHGGVGLGKTHLLQAICLKIVEANPRAVLYYTSCEGFITQFIESVQSGEMSEFRHRFRDVDVLVIDDIHFLTKRDRSQEEFFHTFNALFQANKQIILSSDAPPEEIPDLEDRMVSRFKWGLVCKIDTPGYETRVEIVKTKARLRGLTIPTEVAEYVAQRLDSNIRELEGAVVKLQIHSVVDKRPIDLDLARSALGGEPVVSAGEPTIQNIINVVTDFYAIRLADLQSKHRQRSIALPRQICMYLARRCTRHSLEEIGGFFGGRDHTTVMHAIRSVESKVAVEPEFDTVLRSLELRVRVAKAPVPA
ncbi:Chromosomal replication initiator protein DnaA [Phycisphaerales bacterium]|nr:Chromosomal replication initiator protein DnaA [Phycisphaerales bacterium]